MKVVELARRLQRAGRMMVLASLLYLGASVLLVCVLVALNILPASILRSNGKILQLVMECFWIGVPGSILWLVSWILARATNKD
ncbi:MAG: hypothetical protein ABR905_15940 [Terracidiphilus sp.]|jgi:hypothetical protein